MRSRATCLAPLAAALCLWCSTAAAQTPAPDETVFQPRSMTRIAPGTRITLDQPPQGWTALILKSQPVVNSGDLDRVPSLAIKLAGMLFSTLVAGSAQEPGSNPPQYCLTGAAVGLGMNIGGVDTIVSSATAREQGLNLGMISSIVLSQSEALLPAIVEVGRSRTMEVIDAPTIMVKGESHAPVVLRHAFLCDPRDGRIYTVAWVYERDASHVNHVWDGSMRLLPQPAIVECSMRVDADEFSALGQPKPNAFAMVSLPDGTLLRPSNELLAAASVAGFTPSDTHRLEVALWTAIFDPTLTAQPPTQPTTR